MRLEVDAVMCKNGKWFDGELDGFVFRIKEKVTGKEDVEHISAHIPLTEWLKRKGIEDSNNKIAITLMKNIKIFSRRNKKINVNSIVGTGVDKLYVYAGRPDGFHYANENHNFLCSQCMWTCKQGKTVSIYSCKAFNSEKSAKK